MPLSEAEELELLTLERERFKGADQPPMSPAPAAPSKYGLGNAFAQGLTMEFADELNSGLLAGTVGTGKGLANALRERDLGAIPKAIGNE